MIRTVFRLHENRLTGFTLKGHANMGDEGLDIVCAAVSSAAYMTVNALTDVIFENVELDVADGYLHCNVLNGSESAQVLLRSFRFHMEQLQEEYPRAIKITTEV